MIIGNSAAGVAAAKAARGASSSARITVIGEEGGSAYYRCLIPEVLAGSAGFDRIIFFSGEDFRKEGIDLVDGRAVELDPGRRRVALEDGREVAYDRLLVATGAEPVLPDLPGRDLEGVLGFRTYADAWEAARAAEGATDAVVLGGGLVSLKAAYSLKKRGLPRVTLVVASQHLMTRQLDPESASLVEQVFRDLGVKVIFRSGAAAFLPGPGTRRVGSVLMEDGKEVPAQLVIAGKGVRPRSELVAGAGGKVRRGIVTDEFLRTSLPGVFAAGDCAEVTDVLTGEASPSGLWPLAVEQGRHAGLSMAGRPAVYPPALTARNSVRFGRLSVVSAGRRDPAGEQVAVRRREPAPGCLKKFFVRDDKLTGYILINDVEGAGLYTWLVRSGRRVPGLANILAEDRLPLWIPAFSRRASESL